MSDNAKAMPATHIHITLPGKDELTGAATLLVRRGDLARVEQLEYQGVTELAQAIQNAIAGLEHLEKFPPPVVDAPEPAKKTDLRSRVGVGKKENSSRKSAPKPMAELIEDNAEEPEETPTGEPGIDPALAAAEEALAQVKDEPSTAISPTGENQPLLF